MGVIYLGALAMLLITRAFWQLDPLTSSIVKKFSLGDFKTLLENSVYRNDPPSVPWESPLSFPLADIVLGLPARLLRGPPGLAARPAPRRSSSR